MRFSELSMGDTFSLTGHSGREAYEVIGPHQARVVNGTEVRNIAGHELVSLLGREVDRLAAERADLERRGGSDVS